MNGTIFSDFAAASLPIVILIATGFLARRLLLPDANAWSALDRINFRLLIPALIIGTIAQTDIFTIAGLRIAAAIILALAALAGVLFLSYRAFVPAAMDAPAFSSLFQTSTRWNASIALVVAGLIFEPIAITVVAVIMVVLMPIVNAINIIVLVRLHGDHGTTFAGTMVKAATNPIIVGCVTGIALSAAQVPLPGPVAESLDILGMAAIGTILLSLGAGLEYSGLQGRAMPIATSCFFKLALMPAMVLVAGHFLTIDPAFLVVATVATAMPTATNGYVVAQEMGGDAPLYAVSATMQTFLSFVTVPLWILACLQMPWTSAG